MSPTAWSATRLAQVPHEDSGADATYSETARLATVRYQGGVTSFLEVLVTEQDYFTSELQLSQAWFQEMQNYVQLYQALGGGWDPAHP